MSTAAIFLGVPTGGQGRGWCRRVGGDMGHTQLKTGVQGGHVEHRGETEVKVVQKEESGGQEGKQKQKKPVKKKEKKRFLVPRPQALSPGLHIFNSFCSQFETWAIKGTVLSASFLLSHVPSAPYLHHHSCTTIFLFPPS